MKKQKQSGFTLIELMITVTIIGILAFFAYPSYRHQVLSIRRVEAQADLLQLANFMERFFTENGRYDQDMAGNSVGLPFTRSPQGGSTIYYKMALQAVNATSYSLRATPQNAQATDGYLELLESGARRWDKNNNTVIDAGEWDWEK